MMDIALELGQPVGVLSRRMPLAELLDWQAYTRKRLLPSRRVEFYLAQIALLIAQTMGGARNAKLTDFLLEPQPQQVVTVDDDQLEHLIEAFDFKPRNKKNGPR